MVRPHRFLICLIVSAAGLVGTASAGVPIGGQVVGPGGRVLTIIRVGLEPIPREFERIEARLGGTVGPDPAVETATDDNGFFELPAPSLGAWKVAVALGEDGEVEGAAPGQRGPSPGTSLGQPRNAQWDLGVFGTSQA